MNRPISNIKRCKECGEDFVWRKETPMLCKQCMEKKYG